MAGFLGLKKKKTIAGEAEVKWHSLDKTQTCGRLSCDENGLNASQVKERRGKYGPNTLPVKKVPSVFLIFFKQFLSPLIYVLIAAGITSLAIGDAKDAVFIFLVIVINALVGTYQEWRAEKSAVALRDMIKVRVTVRRDGKKQEIESVELVPGDIVYFESGSKIPADSRIIEANSLEIDESFLTGESMAALKHTEKLPENTGVADRLNMAFAGASVTKGRCTGIVAATGLNTEVGKIAKTVNEEAGAKAPLIIRMERFSGQVSVAVLLCCAVVAAVLILNGQPVTEVFFLAVALAVSAIPEGLPVALTVALSVATQRMSKRNVIVRRLTAVESLGSCTYIASDKTGTLTVNQQTIQEIMLPSGREIIITGQGYNDAGDIEGLKKEELKGSQIEALMLSGILCNEAELKMENGKWKHFGDAMDVAFISLSLKAGMDYIKERQRHHTTGDIPYESEKKYAAKFYMDNSKMYAAAKGAVETIAGFCSYMADPEGKTVPFDAAFIEKQSHAMALKGYRVLAVARGAVVEASEGALKGLVFLGLAGFIDPLRQEAIDAVNKCKTAGIEVAMVTGDHPVTAFAIAKKLGICSAMEEVVTGETLDKTGDPESDGFMKVVASSHVFARVAPMQKLQIVGALIKAGHYVAVTGDGVNDAPALKKANIGVAMGSGTDVAKDTGSMIVTDDNFASIVAGVEEGRFAYDNVRKVIYLLISTGAAELLLFFLAVIFTSGLFGGRIESPLIAIQLLWLNLVTNGLQGAALAFEAGEEGAMRKKPRSPKEGIFNALMLQQTILSGLVMAISAFAVWYVLLSSGMDVPSARNITLLLMVLLQSVHTFNCRSEYVSAFKIKISSNYFLIASVILAQGLHIVCMSIPFMQDLLSIEPITIKQWVIVAAISLALLLTMEIFKLIKAGTARA